MAHEELKKQYEEDEKVHGMYAYRLWEYIGFRCSEWKPCCTTPSWHPYNQYRRKEPHCERRLT